MPLDLQIEILSNLKAKWERHAEECDRAPKAFLLNPGNHSLLGWDEALGVPLLPDERVEPKRCLLLCGVGKGGACAEGDVFWDADGQSYVFEVEDEG